MAQQNLVSIEARNFEGYQVEGTKDMVVLLQPCNGCEQEPRYILESGKDGQLYTIPKCRLCETARGKAYAQAKKLARPSEPELQFLTASTRKKVAERYPSMEELKAAKVGDLKALIGDYMAGKVAGWLIGRGFRD